MLFPRHTPSWSIPPNTLHFVYSFGAHCLRSSQALASHLGWGVAGFKDGQSDLLANTGSFFLLPLCHYVCTGNLRSQIICFYLDNCRCDSQLWIMWVWEFFQKRAIGQKFQEKLIFSTKSRWKFKACHIYSKNTLLSICVWPLWNANIQKHLLIFVLRMIRLKKKSVPCVHSWFWFGHLYCEPKSNSWQRPSIWA